MSLIFICPLLQTHALAPSDLTHTASFKTNEPPLHQEISENDLPTDASLSQHFILNLHHSNRAHIDFFFSLLSLNPTPPSPSQAVLEFSEGLNTGFMLWVMTSSSAVPLLQKHHPVLDAELGPPPCLIISPFVLPYAIHQTLLTHVLNSS